ncbi:MAG: pyruvate kinase [Candidatus Diapherotrites archaeon]|uniref:Pyruvate kinase n=1 Tax=Candidatus Iainarchaeum sp. TaxID=3101447 RepID=A0A8T4LFY5_9ARCH|nr:pyruvate kinase [Candidatus Diapherotrites archaeon]
MKKTKIVCTVGPACLEPNVLRQMAAAGMDCVRINCAHGDPRQWSQAIRQVRSVADVPVLIDTKGLDLRAGMKAPIEVKKGDELSFGFHPGHAYWFNHDFFRQAKVGHSVFFSDGLIEAKIIEKQATAVRLRFVSAGELYDHVGVNVLGVKFNVPALQKKDYENLAFARKHNVDFVALSFAQTERDVLAVKKALKGTDIQVIAKIENRQGVKHFDKILEASDGIMVARGDLGVELPQERVPLLQKEFIRKCNAAGKFVIVATQVLESMIHRPRATRAETSDAANAILDGADALMLSGETAKGEFPVEAVKTLASIARATEHMAKSTFAEGAGRNVSKAIASAAAASCTMLHVSKVIVMTRSGYTARLISRYRLQQPILAVTASPAVKRQLMLYYGVQPCHYPGQAEKNRIIPVAKWLHAKGLIEGSDLLLFTAGRFATQPATNMIQINWAKEVINASERSG